MDDPKQGDRVCDGCGVVVSERMIDETSEWRVFGASDRSTGADPNRVGAALNPLLSSTGSLGLSLSLSLSPSPSLSLSANKQLLS